MAVEDRRIELSAAEVITALRLFHLQKDRKDLFVGEVTNASIGMRDNACFFKCEIVHDGSRTPFEAGKEVLAAAIIYYCSRQNIPLPRKAEKRLEVLDGQLALCLRIGRHEEATRPAQATTPNEQTTPGGPQIVAFFGLNDIKMRRFRREINTSAPLKGR